MIKVSDIFDFINSIAPFETQETWDNSGMLIGDGAAPVKKIAVCLDVTNDTLDKAFDFGADLVVSHHPIIWDPLKSVPFDSPVGRAIKNGTSIISAHTNWDFADAGVNDVLATVIGLSDIHRITDEGDLAMPRVGTLKVPVPANEFAKVVAEALDTVVRVSSPEKMIKTVAVCGGAGASFMNDIAKSGADAYVTGDAKHNDFLDATDLHISLLAAGHYETETVSMPVLMKLLKNEFPDIEYKYIESAPVFYVG